MVTVDHNKNIQRIIDVIKADPAVFETGGATVGKLREVNFGDPERLEKTGIDQLPAAYVTTSNSIQKTSYPYGIAFNTNINSTTVQYEITVVAESKETSERSQKQLYELVKNLKTTLENEPKYFIPSTTDDPIFTRSIVNEIPWDSKTRGKLVTSISFILIATIGETSIINIPGIGDIVLLSDTGEAGRQSSTVSNDEGSTKVSKGENVGSRFMEYEYDTVLYSSIQVLIDADNPLALTLKYPSGNRIINVKLVYQRDSKRFDGLHTVILQSDKITA